MRLATYLLILIMTVLTMPAYAKEYILGVGDIVSMNVYGHPDMQLEAVQVDEDGKIAVPMLGAVTVAGLTPSAAEKNIAKALEKGGFIIKPNINLMVQQYRSKQVSVLGQVTQPGKYSLESNSRITDLLALAGGINALGSDTVILIHKQDGQLKQTKIDTIQLFKENKFNLDYPVSNGDILYVPRAPVFYIYGEVQHPGAYRLEEHTNIMQAIAQGGGITVRGTQRGVEIHRENKDGKTVTIRATPNEPVQSNDVIYVKESLF